MKNCFKAARRLPNLFSKNQPLITTNQYKMRQNLGLLRNQPVLQNPMMRAFGTVRELDPAEMRNLSKLLNVMDEEYPEMNESIDWSDDVRIVFDDDTPSKIMSFNRALEYSEAVSKDLMAVNLRLNPAIFKLFDFRKEMYQKFLERYVDEKALASIKAKKSEKVKTVTLKSRMNISDLDLKIQQAASFCERFGKVRIYLRMTEDTEEKGRNLLENFRSRTESDFIIDGEIKDYKSTEEFFQPDGKVGYKKFQNVSYILVDPEYDAGEDELDNINLDSEDGDIELNFSKLDTVINSFYNAQFKESNSMSNLIQKTRERATEQEVGELNNEFRELQGKSKLAARLYKEEAFENRREKKARIHQQAQEIKKNKKKRLRKFMWQQPTNYKSSNDLYAHKTLDNLKTFKVLDKSQELELESINEAFERNRKGDGSGQEDLNEYQQEIFDDIARRYDLEEAKERALSDVLDKLGVKQY